MSQSGSLEPEGKKKIVAVEEKYPCYAIPIRELLKLKEWIPHQDLLEQGILVKMSQSSAKQEKIIFVSHQWTSFEHPDPEGNQLRALQAVLRKLAAGKMVARTNGILEAHYAYKRVDGPTHWQNLIENGFIWHDFSCIPQPLSHKAKMDAMLESEQKKPASPIQTMASIATMLDEIDPISSDESNASAAVPFHAGSVAHAGMLNADHRKGSENDDAVIKRLTRQLTAAVDSIPAYIDRCESMWVLVPPIAHHDVEGAICNFSSWRTRGWCRMEFAAAHLATHELPVLVVESENSPPQYFNPCEVPKLAAARGTFSYEEDRKKVVSVLLSMTRAKVGSLFHRGDLLFARLFQLYSPWFSGAVDSTGGTEFDRHDVASSNEDQDNECRPAEDAAGALAIERIKRRIGWRDDKTEAAFTKQTGINLLTFATAFNDIEAVRYLCNGPDAAELMAIKGQKIKLTNTKQFPHRKLLGAKMLVHERIWAPLSFAVVFGSTEMVNCLLKAGYPVEPGQSTQEMIMWGLVDGKVENCESVVSERPGAVNFKDTDLYGFGNLLHFAVWMTESNKMKAVYEWLHGHGAIKAFMKKRCALGTTPFAFFGFNLDATKETVNDLVKYDREFFLKDLNTPVELPGGIKAMLLISYGLSGVSSGAAKTVRMFQSLLTGGTVLHDACWWGNLELIQVLIELGADPFMRCPERVKGHVAAGLAPYEIVLLRWEGSATQAAVAAILEANGHGACVTNASRHTARAAKIEHKANKIGRQMSKKQRAAVVPIISAEGS